MSEYTDYKTYQELIKYNPNIHSLEKYESKIANAESQRQHDLLVALRDKSKIGLLDLVFNNIESTLKIIQKLGIIEYYGFDNNEVSSSYQGMRGQIKLGIKLLLNHGL